MLVCKKLFTKPKMEKDKGYAWVVLVMSFIAHTVHHGFTAAVVGNLTVAHQNYFNIDLQSSSLIGSVHTGTVFLLAPIASVLIKKFGCRFTQILAGVLAVTGMGLSYLSTQPWHAYILFGVIAAAGISFSYVTSSEILSQYFEKKKHLAFSLAVVGNFVGNSVWPVGSQYLLDKYGYSKAMGIMAVLHILHIIAGICFISPEVRPEQAHREDDSKLADSSLGNGRHSDNGAHGLDNKGHTISVVDMSGDVQHSSEAKPDLQDTSEINSDLPKELEVVSGQENQLHAGDYQETVKEDDLEKRLDLSERKEDSRLYSVKESFVVLLRNPQIWILLANAMAWNVTNTALYVLINDYILKTTGLDTDQVAFGITVLGIGKLAGSMLVAVTSSVKYDRLILHIISVIIYSIVTITITYSRNKVMYYLFMAMWGLFQGASIANLVSTIIGFCGSQLLAVLLGLEFFAEGIGSIGLTPLATYIGVKTEEKYALIFAGTVGIFGSVILAPMVVRRNRKDNHTS